MFRTWRLAGLAGLTILSASIAWGDRAPANGPPSPEVAPLFGAPPAEAGTLPIVVKIDPAAKVSRLILPPEAAPAEGMGEALPGNAPRPKANDGSLFESPTRTVLAGLFLSLAIGAVFFVPRTSGAAQGILAAVVGLGMLGTAAVALANKAPFDPPKPTIAKGAVKVEWTGRKGAPITLILAGPDFQGAGVPGVNLPPVLPPALPKSVPLPNLPPPPK